MRELRSEAIEQLAPGVRHLLMYGLMAPHSVGGRATAFGLLHPSRHAELQALWREVGADLVAWCRQQPPDDPPFDIMGDADRARLVIVVDGPDAPLDVVIAAPSASASRCFGVYEWLARQGDDE